MVLFLTFGVTLVALGWTYTLLMGCQTWESRRYARGRVQHLPFAARLDQRVSLFVPCKGYDLQLADNLEALFRFDYKHYELVFIVESGRDAACSTISELIAKHPKVPARLVISGQCRESGQKVHNLLVATDDLPEETDVLAFVDSDARPNPAWLSCLVSGLGVEGVGAITGYRWMVPLRRRLANYFMYTINSATAALYGPRGQILVWGGSWAIRRETFEKIGLRQAWRGTLSDDMVASRALSEAGYQIVFDPRCMTSSPVDTNIAGALEFLRRQFLIGRRYGLRMWILGFIGVTLFQLVLWGSLVVGIVGTTAGSLYGMLALGNFFFLYVATVVRCWMRQDIGRSCLPERRRQLSRARWFDIFAGPAVGPFNLLAYLCSCVGNCITWRDVRYHIAHGGQVVVLDRQRVLPAERPAKIEDLPAPLRRAA